MTILGPTFGVDLLTMARRIRYYVIRVLYVSILLFFFFTNYQTAFFGPRAPGSPSTVSIRQAAEFAQAFFYTFTTIQVFAVLLLTPAVTAGAIADERFRRTIDYLLTTDLRNHEIVLGKLAARFLQMAMFILAGLPILALAGLFGGIDYGALAIVFGVSLIVTLSLGSLSILVSVWTRRPRDAVIRTYIIEIALLAVPPLALSLQGYPAIYAWIEPVVALLLACNPVQLLWKALVGFVGSGSSVWADTARLVVYHSLFAAACLATAIGQMRRVCTGRGPWGKGRWLAPREALGRGWRLPRLWKPELGDAPMLWKELFAEGSRGLGKVATIALVLVILGVVIPGGVIFWKALGEVLTHAGPNPWFGAVWEFNAYLRGMTGLFGTLLVLAAGVRAAGAVSSERERQTLDILLTTPLTPAELIWGKMVGSLYALRAGYAALGLLWLLGAIVGALHPVAVVVLAAELAIYSLFATALGLRLSLTARSTVRGMATTMGILLFVGGGYLFCCIPVLLINRIEQAAQLFAAGCIPLILGISGFPLDYSVHFHPDDSFLITAVIISMVGYAMAASGLIAAAIQNFDWLTGRSGRDAWGSRPQVTGEG